MYNVPYFKEKDSKVLIQFMREHSFAMLIGSKENMPVATQVPFLIEEREGKVYLQAHIMRNTDHHKALVSNPNALCIFTGAHAYISASSYINPQAVSTWNYMSVHVKGKVTFLDDAALLLLLEKTTSHYEQDENSPAAFGKLEKEYVEKLMKAIVGLEIDAEQMDHVFKLSQNRDERSYSNIVNKLKEGDADALRIAEEMEKRKLSIFKQAK